MLSGMIYSIKKRWNKPTGSTPFWLRYHEIVSIFGALLVIIHANGSFNGLAGLSIAMMVVVSVSGFLGHYIYTRIPRNSMGKEKKLTELKKELENIKNEINMNSELQPKNPKYSKLSKKAERLKRQIKQLDTARRLLSGWRTWHIPMTIIFLLTVIIHMISLLYYGNY
jgi:hypothetical protein